MSDLAEVEKSSVQCDEDGCGWKLEVPLDEIPDWHKKPCPECGKGEILSDADLKIWAVVAAIASVQVDGKAKPGVKLRVDTSGLRK